MSGRASAVAYQPPKMETDLSPRKTLLVLVIVVGCFAVLWPKVFYPMLVGSANQYIKPSPIDKTAGCCDVISENDVNTIKLMSELCGSIINATEDKPLSGKEIVQKCRQEVLETCGIDISVVLQEQVRLGQSVKQILNEVRSLNGSLCLKYNFGVAPWKLGVPHRVTVRSSDDAPNIRQERPHHLRSELIHPAFRERGRAIPQPQSPPVARPAPRIVEGRPGPIPGMKPILGGAGHVVPPSKQGTSSMSVIMPIYTIGIVIFFTYTLMKILFRKQPEGVGGDLYPAVDTDPNFRKEVFEAESSRLGPRLTRENIASKLVVNAISALLDEVDQEIEARRKGSEVVSQDLVNGTLSNGDAVKPQDEDQPTVKVLGMEMTASCEGGKKWIRPDSPLPPTPSPPPPTEPMPPPQEIYLEGALPAQSQLLVAESAIEPEPSIGEDPAVILSGKMTLSVISVDSETGVEEIIETLEGGSPVARENSPKVEETDEENLFNGAENAVQIEETQNVVQSPIEKDIANFLSNLENTNENQTPVITFDNEDISQTVQVNELEKEVDELIQEALQNIELKEAVGDSDIASEEIEAQSFQSSPNSLLLTETIEEKQTPIVSLDTHEAIFDENIKQIAPETHEENLESLLFDNIKAEIDALLESETAQEIVEFADRVDESNENDGEEKKTDLTEDNRKETTNTRMDDVDAEDEHLQSTVEDFKEELKKELDLMDTLDTHETSVEAVDLSVAEPKEELNSEVDLVIISEEIVVEKPKEETELDVEVVNTLDNERYVETTAEDFREELKQELDLIEALDKNETNVEVVITEKSIDSIMSEPLKDEINLESEVVTNLEENSKEETKTEAEIVNITDNERNAETTVEDINEELKKELDLIDAVDKNEAKIEEAIITERHLEPKEEINFEVSVVENLEETKTDVDVVNILDNDRNVETTVEIKEELQKELNLIDIVEKNETDVEQNLESSVEQPKEEADLVHILEERREEAIVEKSKEETKTDIKRNVETIEQVAIEDEQHTKAEQEEATLQIVEQEKQKSSDVVEEELDSDDEEIEEIEYEEETEEELEEEEEEESEEIPVTTNPTVSSSIGKINGERSEDIVEESKYTTASGTTAAENDISDADDEELTDEEEIIEIEEEIDEDDYEVEEGNDVNHIAGDSEEI